MMVTVTKPMEDAMKRVPGLKLLRSTTSRGSCEISAFLDWDVDVAKSQSLIESRLNQIRGDLPPTVNITVERMNPAILPVMGYTLEAPGRSALELRKLALYTIKPFLSQVDGVSSVQIQGGRTKEYQVQLLPDQLAALGLGPDDVTHGPDGHQLRAEQRLPERLPPPLPHRDRRHHSAEGATSKTSCCATTAAASCAWPTWPPWAWASSPNTPASTPTAPTPCSSPCCASPMPTWCWCRDGVRAKVAALQAGLPRGVRMAPYYDQADFVSEVVQLGAGCALDWPGAGAGGHGPVSALAARPRSPFWAPFRWRWPSPSRCCTSAWATRSTS